MGPLVLFTSRQLASTVDHLLFSHAFNGGDETCVFSNNSCEAQSKPLDDDGCLFCVDLDEIKMIRELAQVLPNLKRRDCVLLRMLQSALSSRPKPAPHAFGPGTLLHYYICNNPCIIHILYTLNSVPLLSIVNT